MVAKYLTGLYTLILFSAGLVLIIKPAVMRTFYFRDPTRSRSRWPFGAGIKRAYVESRAYLLHVRACGLGLLIMSAAIFTLVVLR